MLTALLWAPIWGHRPARRPPAATAPPGARQKRSKWLCKNCTFVRLAPGECFYDKAKVPKKKVENKKDSGLSRRYRGRILQHTHIL